MTEKLNLMGFEVSRQEILPNKTFPHQPDSFFASDIVKDTIEHEVIDDKSRQLSQNVIECVVNLKINDKEDVMCGILQSCSQLSTLVKTTSLKLKADLSESLKQYVEFAAGDKIFVTGFSLGDSIINVHNELISLELTDIDYQRNLTNVVLSFENTYHNE